MKTIEEEIVETEQKLAQLQNQKTKQDRLQAKLTPEQKIAIQLHALLCRWNHTDACDWEYRDLTDPNTWTNQNSPHARFLKQAEQALKIADTKTIIQLAQILEGY